MTRVTRYSLVRNDSGELHHILDKTQFAGLGINLVISTTGVFWALPDPFVSNAKPRHCRFFRSLRVGLRVVEVGAVNVDEMMLNPQNRMKMKGVGDDWEEGALDADWAA